MKKDDNTTNYSARLVCEKCGYVFGLKEVAYIEHGFSAPWDSPRIETKCYNEIYPKYCPKCKREAQHISYGTKLGVYCSPIKEEAEILTKKRKEEEIRKGIEELRKINKFEQYFSVTPAAATGILAYCNGDVNETKCCEVEKSVACVTTPVCYDCEAVKITCPYDKCPEKNAVSPKYFEKHGLYPCAVFMTLKNATDFAEYLLKRLDLCSNTDDKISLTYVLTSINFYNGYARLHKSGENYSIGMPTTNEGRCGWTKKELETYGIAIDFEENKLFGRTYCVYLPVPKYFGSKKEDK